MAAAETGGSNSGNPRAIRKRRVLQEDCRLSVHRVRDGRPDNGNPRQKTLQIAVLRVWHRSCYAPVFPWKQATTTPVIDVAALICISTFLF